MKRLTGLMTACVMASALAAAADATPVEYTAALDGTSQNPPVATGASGVAYVWIDTSANTMRVVVSFSGLNSPDTAAHIHCCIAAPGNVGVATPVPYFPGFPLGVTSGSYSQTFDMTLASSYNPAFVTANGGTAASAEAALFAGIMNGEAYLNIHTRDFPGGEIRGFLTLAPVPEPATFSLIALGLAGAFAAKRRR